MSQFLLLPLGLYLDKFIRDNVFRSITLYMKRFMKRCI